MLLPLLIQLIGGAVYFGSAYLHHFVPRDPFSNRRFKIQILGCVIGLVIQGVGSVMLFRRIFWR